MNSCQPAGAAPTETQHDADQIDKHMVGVYDVIAILSALIDAGSLASASGKGADGDMVERLARMAQTMLMDINDGVFGCVASIRSGEHA